MFDVLVCVVLAGSCCLFVLLVLLWCLDVVSLCVLCFVVAIVVMCVDRATRQCFVVDLAVVLICDVGDV